MYKLLIVEDDQKIARFLDLELRHEGFDTCLAHDGRSALDLALSQSFDLILLDIMLPGLNGMEVCRRIRLASQVPIIMLTAKDDTMDKVMGLDFGADDYMTKPFAIEELLARIRRVFRSHATHAPTSGLLVGPLSIDGAKREVRVNGDVVELTKTEYDLLLMLAENRNKVLTREQILDSVWGYDCYSDSKIVDVYIRYLRSKIDDRYQLKLIHTIRGVGYLLKYES